MKHIVDLATCYNSAFKQKLTTYKLCMIFERKWVWNYPQLQLVYVSSCVVVVDKVLNKFQWDHLCLIAMAIDGVSSMIGFQVGLTT